jgi:RNA polymerase sigma factor (sigma-70 family)
VRIATAVERSGEGLLTTDRQLEVETLYGERAVQLWSFGRRLGLTPDAAEEAVQEAFSRLLRLVPREWPAAVAPWLFRVVHNLAMDHHRRRRQASVDDNAPDMTASPESGLDRVALWSEVDRLPERQRAAVYLRYRADLDFETIAGVLGITASGARANCFRGLAQLRERMNRDG